MFGGKCHDDGIYLVGDSDTSPIIILLGIPYSSFAQIQCHKCVNKS